jgi:hypothetical protein
MLLNFPSAQLVQVVEPMAAWKRPALQLAQAWASILAENWPAAHARHPRDDLYFPAVHDVVESEAEANLVHI